MAIAAAMAAPLCAGAQTHVPNPVVKGIADCGVLRYAGKYYMGGVRTYGDFLISRDLVNWNSKAHVFDLDNDWTRGTGAKNNQVHADDISYSGGLFHLLFSVNYWGDDRHIVHITHATSPSVTGPYREVRTDQWYENRIDPQVFCDEDGRLYLYMVKFTDGNTIWGRPLNADFSFAGDAVQQFSSQQGTWETYDNRVAEGPFVVKYRGRYYMMYNANHTSASFGNYRLGVCEAASPLAFGPGGKYGGPVVGPDFDSLSDLHADLLTFGTGEYRPADLHADRIEFAVNTPLKGRLHVKLAQRGGVEVSLNGIPLNSDTACDYRLTCIPNKLLRQGTNVVTVKRRDSNSKLTALAFYDLPADASRDLLLTPGQPNIVRGPNGWEWWLVYMANTAWNRDQYVDRIHFTDSRLWVDGITDSRTPGYHPVPALPEYSGASLDSVPTSDSYLLEATFRQKSHSGGLRVGGVSITLPSNMDVNAAHVWRVEKNCGMLTAWIDNVLVADHVPTASGDNSAEWIGQAADYSVLNVSGNAGFDEYAQHFSGWQGMTATADGLRLGAADALKGSAAHCYELSAQLRNATPYRGRYGIYAAYADKKNFVRVAIDAARQQLEVEQCSGGHSTVKAFALDTVANNWPDLKYSDNFEKQYRFDADTYVSEILIPKAEPVGDEYAHNIGLKQPFEGKPGATIADTQTYSWLDGDTWRPLQCKKEPSANPAFERLTFAPVLTKGLRMINADPTDHSRNIYRIRTKRQFAAAQQLRVEKDGRILHVFVDNREIVALTMKKDLAARIGVFSDGNAEVSVADMLWYVKKR